MPRVSYDRLKVLASTKELENVMESLHAEGNEEKEKVGQFFKEKEDTIEGVFKQAAGK